MRYTFVWKAEVLFFVATWVVAFGSEFLLTGDNQITDWGTWLQNTAIASTRVAVAGIISSLTAWQQGKNPHPPA